MNGQLNPDDTIDRVLTGLAHVEAAPEFERRVLQAVQLREAERKMSEVVPAAAWLSLPWFSSGRWAIAAGLAILGIAASVAVRKQHEHMPEDAVLQQHTSPVTAVAPLTGTAEVRPERRSRQVVFSTSPDRKSAPKPEPISDLEVLAISEMLAPSKPAPPLPLTHQEKLLAEAVHQADPIQLSSLRPEVRARQMELSKAEFHDFFEPAPAKNNE